MTATTTMKAGQYLTMRATPAETTDDGSMVIRGVANDSSVIDGHGTRIRLSQQALDGFRSNAVCLYGHDVNEPIGSFRSVAYNGPQLEVEAVILPGTRTPNGTDIQSLIRAGALNAFSVRFDDYTQVRGKDCIEITADALDEISLVSLPSNKASLITMRSKGVTLYGADELMPDPVRVADARTVTTRSAGPLSYADLTKRLSDEISEMNTGWDMYCVLVSIYDDYCIHMDYTEGTYQKQPYAVDADGNVTLTGTSTEVLPVWTEVNTNGNPDDDMEMGRARLHPDDLAAIVQQVRNLTPPGPVAPEPAPVDIRAAILAAFK
jgi:HK97 family phage prohead protease